MPRAKLYDPNSNDVFAFSRSALEQFINCPRCFYQQRRLGLKQPRMVPLTLAVATDALLKNEFDDARNKQINHPIWDYFGLNVRAYQHPDMETWRNNFKGIRVYHARTNFEIFGAVDDVWQSQKDGSLHVVDYKSTSKKGEPSIEGGGFGDGYKRQMEIYQWLLRSSGFDTNDVGYFLYVNGQKEGGFFNYSTNGKMKFVTTLIEYKGNTDWVEEKILKAKECLNGTKLPISSDSCDNCRYFEQRKTLEQ